MPDSREGTDPSLGSAGQEPGTREFVDIPSPPLPERNFRMERMGVGAFAPLVPHVSVEVDGVRLSAGLLNISQSGAALAWPPHAPWPRQGARLDLRIGFDDVVAWSGPGRVERLGVDVLGVSFQGLVDLDAVLQVARIRSWRAPAGDPLARRSWKVDGHAPLKALLADFRLLLEDVQDRVASLERDLPSDVWNNPAATAGFGAVRELVRQQVVPALVAASDELNAAWLGADVGAAKSLAPFADRLLRPLFMTSPFMARARNKPLRYAGDFILMNHIYRDDFAGNSLFGRVMTAFGVGNRTGDAVRARKVLLRDALAAAIEARSGSVSPVRVLAVAAGPAEEIFDLLQTSAPFRTEVEFVLFEQERAALAFAYRRLTQELGNGRHPEVRVTYRNESATQLIFNSSAPADLGRYTVVYSAGLFDYFGEPVWVRAARTLADCVEPGGSLWIGNMVPESPARWFMELLLDWNLRHRPESRTLDLARRSAPAGFEVGMRRDATGINPFAVLERP